MPKKRLGWLNPIKGVKVSKLEGKTIDKMKKSAREDERNLTRK